MTLPDKIKALPLPATRYVLAREQEPYSDAWVTAWPGYGEEDMRALLNAAATLAAEHEARAQALADALKALKGRLVDCLRQPINAAEAFDSFYQELVDDALQAWEESQ